MSDPKLQKKDDFAAQASGGRESLGGEFVAFLKENLGGKAVRTAADQQALLYLLQNYCSCGGCGRCPLS